MIGTKMMLIGTGALGLMDFKDLLSMKDAGVAVLAIGVCIVLYRDGKKEAARRDKVESERQEKLETIITKSTEAITSNTEVLRLCHMRGERGIQGERGAQGQRGEKGSHG